MNVDILSREMWLIMTEQMYDVIVIGGGSAGLMAAVGASKNGAKVLLLEKGDKLARKLIISGGGRCNVTNAKEIDELIKNIPGNGRFMYSAFNQFGNQDIIQFFEGLGVQLKEEDNGRMFPVSDKAITVANTLINYIRSKGVTIRLNAPVQKLLSNGAEVTGVLLKDGEQFNTKAVVIATGGKSVPKTGSTGDGYPWARSVGHTITPFYPTEVPITSDDTWIKEKTFQGLSLRDVTVTLFNKKEKAITVQRGDLIFTHFGISGPAALRLGHYVSVAHMKDGVGTLNLKIDLFPDRSFDQIYKESLQLVEKEPKKAVKNVLKGYIPERLILPLLSKADIGEDITFAHLAKKNWHDFVSLLKGIPLHVTGTLSIEEAFVTGGGVSTKEIDPKTFASKLVKGLYFAGEVMDVHAHTGGYNITVAFSSGYNAGISAAEQSKFEKAHQ